MEKQPGPHADAEPELRPRIYVASLSDYNAGRLHGAWIDATQNPEEIQEAVQRMLATSPQFVAEEWAIHDYEGFGCARISEQASFETVSRIAQGIKAHGGAFAAWVGCTGDDSEESLDRFEDAYLGRWDSLVDYAENLAGNLGITEEVMPEDLRPYVSIDIDRLVNDLEVDLVVTEAEGGGVHIFNPCI